MFGAGEAKARDFWMMPECRQAKVTRVPLVADGQPDSFLPPICTSFLPSSSLPHFASLLLSPILLSTPPSCLFPSVIPSSPLPSSFTSSLVPLSISSIASPSLPLSSFPFSLSSFLHPFLPSFSLFLSSPPSPFHSPFLYFYLSMNSCLALPSTTVLLVTDSPHYWSLQGQVEALGYPRLWLSQALKEGGHPQSIRVCL